MVISLPGKPQPADGVKRKSNTGHVAVVIDRQGPIEEAQAMEKPLDIKVSMQSISSSVKHFSAQSNCHHFQSCHIVMGSAKVWCE